MSIDPTLPQSIGTFAGVAGRLADVDRRLRTLEVNSGTLGTNSVGSGSVAPNSINGTHIAPLSITTGHVQAGSIDASVINAQSIGAAVGQFVNINANQITAGQITAAQIGADQVTAVHIDVGSLAAISTIMGSLSTGNITLDGGSWIRSTVGTRITEFSNSGVRSYDSGTNVETFNLSASTGILTATAVLQTGSTVPGTTIVAGTLDISKLAGELASTVGTSFTSVFDSLDRWTNDSGSFPTVVADSTAQSAGTLARFVSASRTFTREWIPFDPDALYRIRARVRQRTAVTSGSNLFYIGLQAANEAKTVVSGSLHVAANAASLAATTNWTTYTGYFKGFGTAFSPANDAANPSPLPSTTRFIRPQMHVMWSNGTGGQWDIDYLTIDRIEIPANSIAASQLRTDSVIATKIAAGAITATKIGFTQAGFNWLADSGFENLTALPAGWTTNAAAVSFDTTTKVAGTQALRLTNNTGAPTDPNVFVPVHSVVAGEQWTFSAFLRNNGASARTLRAGVQLSDGSFITAATPPAQGIVTGADRVASSADGFVRVWLSLTIPAGITTIRGFVQMIGAANGEHFNIDCMQIERGELPTAWMPHIDPTAIDGRSITSALIRTAASGARLEMDSTGLYAKASDNTNNVALTGANGLELAAASALAYPRMIAWRSAGNPVGDVGATVDVNGWGRLWLRSLGTGANAGEVLMQALTGPTNGYVTSASLSIAGRPTQSGRIALSSGAVGIVLDETQTDSVEINGRIKQLQVSGYSGTSKIGSAIASSVSIYGLEVTVDGSPYFQVRNNGHTYTNAGVVQNISRRALKENITDTSITMGDIRKLRIRDFDMKDPLMRKHAQGKQIGVIVEELQATLPRLVMRDEKGVPESVPYSLFGVIAIKGVQELDARLAALEAKLA